MDNSDRELAAEARRYIIFINVVAPVAMITIAWAFYVGVALFDIDLIQLLKRRNRAPREFAPEKAYLWIAIVGTVVCLGFAWFRVRRALHLADHGIPIVCEVVKVGRISAHGMVRVDYEYVVGGTTYRQSLSCLRETAREYESGSEPLEIVYDPQKPKRAMLKSDVYQKSMSTPDGTQDP